MTVPNERERAMAHCLVDEQPWGPDFEDPEDRRRDRGERESVAARWFASYRAELTAELMKPENVLREAERLLRESSGGYCKVDIRSHSVRIEDAWLHDNVSGRTLPDVYAEACALVQSGKGE